MRLPRVHGAVRGLDDVVGRVEVRLALRQLDDALARRAQLASALRRGGRSGNPGARRARRQNRHPFTLVLTLPVCSSQVVRRFTFPHAQMLTEELA